MSSRKPNSATARLKQDYLRLNKDPVPYITAEPVPANILECLQIMYKKQYYKDSFRALSASLTERPTALVLIFFILPKFCYEKPLTRHYVVCGPEGTPYEGGYYHGKLVFPREFPFKPPAIFMITPSGRFKTNTRLCLSISDYHPDTWNPAWSVSTILTGLLSFMIEKSPTLGSIETSDYEKRQLAFQSLEYNLKNNQFKDLFPDITIEIQEELVKRKNAQKQTTESDPQKRTTTDQSSLQSCLTNLAVFVGFAAFAFTVKYVMVSSATDDNN